METKGSADFISGVIEGFYGRPWTFEQRIRLIDKSAEIGLNSYLYAPKDDSKHRSSWRILYDQQELEHLSALIRSCNDHGIRFIYGISPGVDLVYSSEEDFNLARLKFDQLVSAGCSSWSILFDDIEPTIREQDATRFPSIGQAQVFFANRLFDHLRQPKTFVFCPTEYCSRLSQPSIDESEYLKEIGSGLHPGINIFWTGDKVVSRTLNQQGLTRINEILKRKVVIWENLFANDYDQRRLFLGPFCDRPTSIYESLSGIMINPNCEFELNFVPLDTFGQWMNSAQQRSIYEPERAFRRSIDSWLKVLYSSQEDDRRLTVDQLEYIAQFFYLPYRHGKRAETLLAKFYWLRVNASSSNSARWSKISSDYQSEIAEFNSIYQKMLTIDNRPVLYEIYTYLQDLQSTLNISLKFVRSIAAGKSSTNVLTVGDVEPWSIRGGFNGDFLTILPTRDFQSLFERATLSQQIFVLRPSKQSDRVRLVEMVESIVQQESLASTGAVSPMLTADFLVLQQSSNEERRSLLVFDEERRVVGSSTVLGREKEENDRTSTEIDDQFERRVELLVDLKQINSTIDKILSMLVESTIELLLDQDKECRGFHCLVDQRLNATRLCLYRVGLVEIDANDQFVRIAKDFSFLF